MSKLIVAAAGSGKTEYLVNYSLADNNLKQKILITTFTDNNADEIKDRFYRKYGRIPCNVTILPWFTFILRHCIKPYQDIKYPFDIKTTVFPKGESAKFKNKGTIEYYFTDDLSVYTDKLAPLALELNQLMNSHVILNLALLFDCILIDEVQDMTGYDLELIKTLFKCEMVDLICVGDPRQAIIKTSNSRKNKTKSSIHLIEYFKKQLKKFEIDDYTLNINYRCIQPICDLADKLFPEFESVRSCADEDSDHRGCFIVRESNLHSYLSEIRPIQIRWDIRTQVISAYPAINFGLSKGRTYKHVLIYPTKQIKDWLIKGKNIESDIVKSKLYVGITRAKYSVCFVIQDSDVISYIHNEITEFKPSYDKPN